MRWIKSYCKSESQWRNEPDRALPVLYRRFAQVDVFRSNEGFLNWLGLFDEEVEHWSEWQEHPVDWSAA